MLPLHSTPRRFAGVVGGGFLLVLYVVQKVTLDGDTNLSLGGYRNGARVITGVKNIVFPRQRYTQGNRLLFSAVFPNIEDSSSDKWKINHTTIRKSPASFSLKEWKSPASFSIEKWKNPASFSLGKLKAMLDSNLDLQYHDDRNLVPHILGGAGDEEGYRYPHMTPYLSFIQVLTRLGFNLDNAEGMGELVRIQLVGQNSTNSTTNFINFTGSSFQITNCTTAVDEVYIISAPTIPDLGAGFHYFYRHFVGGSISWNATGGLVMPMHSYTYPVAITANNKYLKHIESVTAFSNIGNSKMDTEKRISHYYYFNVCTYGYSTAFWTWVRWQQEIDWMVMQGVNRPLAMLGLELIWYRVFTEDYGLSSGNDGEVVKDFLTGPAFLPWHWMGNLDGWGSGFNESLNLNIMLYSSQLQKKFLKRIGELGMEPVLPGCAGWVPGGLKTSPNSLIVKNHSEWLIDIKRGSGWGGFDETYYVEPTQPLFKDLASKFYKKYGEVYGVELRKIYNKRDSKKVLISADLYNELLPPSSEPKYLREATRSVYESMVEGVKLMMGLTDMDSANTDNNIYPEPQRGSTLQPQWVLQGWMFSYQTDFWGREQITGLLGALEYGKFLVLDLWADAIPTYEKYQGLQPYIFSTIFNFGGRSVMSGRMKQMERHFTGARGKAKNLAGIGLAPEAIEQDPILYEYFQELMWDIKVEEQEFTTKSTTELPIGLDTSKVEDWVSQFALRRYGMSGELVWMNRKEKSVKTIMLDGTANEDLDANPTELISKRALTEAVKQEDESVGDGGSKTSDRAENLDGSEAASRRAAVADDRSSSETVKKHEQDVQEQQQHVQVLLQLQKNVEEARKNIDRILMEAKELAGKPDPTGKPQLEALRTEIHKLTDDPIPAHLLIGLVQKAWSLLLETVYSVGKNSARRYSSGRDKDLPGPESGRRFSSPEGDIPVHYMGGPESIVAHKPSLTADQGQWGEMKLPYDTTQLIKAQQMLLRLYSEVTQLMVSGKIDYVPDSLLYDVAKTSQQMISDSLLDTFSRIKIILGLVTPKSSDQLKELVFGKKGSMEEGFFILMDAIDQYVDFKHIPRENSLGWNLRRAEAYCKEAAAYSNYQHADRLQLQTHQSETNKSICHRNLMLQITQWGPGPGESEGDVGDDINHLHDYAYKLWSGMIPLYYRPRWKLFFEIVRLKWDLLLTDGGNGAGMDLLNHEINLAMYAFEEKWFRNITHGIHDGLVV